MTRLCTSSFSGSRVRLTADLTLQILPLAAQHTVFGESFVIFGFGEASEVRCCRMW